MSNNKGNDEPTSVSKTTQTQRIIILVLVVLMALVGLLSVLDSDTAEDQSEAPSSAYENDMF